MGKKKMFLFIVSTIFVIGLFVLFGYLLLYTDYITGEYENDNEFYHKKVEINNLYLNVDNTINDEYTNGILFLDDGDTSKLEKYNFFIKLRGNSTKTTNKPSYTIKFEESNNLFDMGENKKWVLLSNISDNSLVKNKIVLDFTQKMRLNYSLNSKYINLYINSEYVGIYLLVEKIETKNNYVNLDSDINNFLLEFEKNRIEDDKIYYVTHSNKWRFTVKDLDLLSDNQERYLEKIFDNLEHLISIQDYKKLSHYIDTKSLIDAYIVEELFKDSDCDYSSLYFYIKNGVLYAGPSWDFDLSMGNGGRTSIHKEYYNVDGYGNDSNSTYEGLYCNKNIFGELWKIKEFRDDVVDRYKNLQISITSLYQNNYMTTSILDNYYNEYNQYFNQDVCLWNREYCGSDYIKNNIYELKLWLKNRNEWLLNEFKAYE